MAISLKRHLPFVFGIFIGGSAVYVVSIVGGDFFRSSAIEEESGVGERTGKVVDQVRRMERFGHSNLSATNPQMALRKAGGIANFTDRLDYLTDFMKLWGGKDPKAAIESALSQPVGSLRKEALGAACAGWAAKDPEAAAHWAVTNLTGIHAAGVYGIIANEWAAVDPSQASAWVSSLPIGNVSETATTAVIHAWTKADPLSAADWIDTFTSADLKARSLATLAAEWCLNSPDDAARWVTGQIDQPGADKMVEALVGTWGDQDPIAASQWVMTLNESHQTEAAALLISLWSAHQPEVAAEWISRFPEGETRASSIPALAETWAGAEPAKATAWSMSLPDSDEKRQAVDGSVRTWAALAPDDLEAWIISQKPSNDSDRMRKIATEVVTEYAPARGLEFAAKIVDAGLRNEAIFTSWESWFEEDAAAAKSWAAGAKLEPELAERLARAGGS